MITCVLNVILENTFERSILVLGELIELINRKSFVHLHLVVRFHKSQSDVLLRELNEKTWARFNSTEIEFFKAKCDH